MAIQTVFPAKASLALFPRPSLKYPSAYTPAVMGYVQQFQQNERLKNEIDRLVEEIGEMNERYATMLEASQF